MYINQLNYPLSPHISFLAPKPQPDPPVETKGETDKIEKSHPLHSWQYPTTHKSWPDSWPQQSTKEGCPKNDCRNVNGFHKIFSYFGTPFTGWVNFKFFPNP